MSHLRVTRRIHAPPERLWELLTHPERWPEWGPSLIRASSTNTPIKLGSRGSVQLALFPVSMPFVITEYTHLRSWTWKVAGLRATTHTLEPLDEALCEVGFGVPSALHAPYLVICRQALKKLEHLATI